MAFTDVFIDSYIGLVERRGRDIAAETRWRPGRWSQSRETFDSESCTEYVEVLVSLCSRRLRTESSLKSDSVSSLVDGESETVGLFFFLEREKAECRTSAG